MKRLLAIALIALALVGVGFAVTYESVLSGRSQILINDTLPADDSLYALYFVLHGSVDLSDSVGIFYSTTDSLVIAIEGSLREDTSLFGWAVLKYDTVTAGTTGYSVCFDNDQYYDILRVLLIALDDSLLTCEAYMVTRP